MKRRIHWTEVSPYDLAMMKKIGDGEIEVDHTGRPPYNPKNVALFEFESPKRKKKNKKKGDGRED